jgi:hypothetical protein
VPTARAPDRSLALALAATCFLGFALFHRGLLSSTDEVGVYETARAIFERGGLDVPEGLHTFPGRDGRIYSHFAIGQSLLALPFYGIGRLADATLPFRVRQSLAGPRVAQGAIVYGGSVEIFAVALYGPVASALLVALFFLFERRLGASPRAATAAALVLAGGTYAGALSPYFLQHTTEALAIVASLYFLFDFRRDGRLRDLALGSACAAATVLIRVPAAVAGPALAGYALFAIRERARAGAPLAPMLAAFAAPAAALAALHAGVNHAKWGTWIASPFLAQTGVLGSPFTIGLVGLLVSPAPGSSPTRRRPCSRRGSWPTSFGVTAPRRSRSSRSCSRSCCSAGASRRGPGSGRRPARATSSSRRRSCCCRSVRGSMRIRSAAPSSSSSRSRRSAPSCSSRCCSPTGRR